MDIASRDAHIASHGYRLEWRARLRFQFLGRGVSRRETWARESSFAQQWGRKFPRASIWTLRRSDNWSCQKSTVHIADSSTKWLAFRIGWQRWDCSKARTARLPKQLSERSLNGLENGLKGSLPEAVSPSYSETARFGPILLMRGGRFIHGGESGDHSNPLFLI